MSEAGLIYTNARIKSIENSLLTNMQLARLSDAKNLDEAFKVLLECGYGSGIAVDDANSYEKLIDFERSEASAFLKSNIFKGSGLQTLLTKQDYHNAKALMKAKYLRLDKCEFMLYPEGNVELSKLQQAVSTDTYDGLPKFMAGALMEIDKAFANENRNPRLIDNLIDKALYKDIFAALKKVNQKLLTNYFVAIVDTSNISSFLRAKKLGLSFKFVSECFISGGKLSQKFFEDLYESSIEQFKEKIKYTDYNNLIVKAIDSENNLVRFEALTEDYLLSIFRTERHDMFSIAPIAGFYLAKMTELKVVKMVVSAIKNNIDNKLLKQRLRELYA